VICRKRKPSIGKKRGGQGSAREIPGIFRGGGKTAYKRGRDSNHLCHKEIGQAKGVKGKVEKQTQRKGSKKEKPRTGEKSEEKKLWCHESKGGCGLSRKKERWHNPKTARNDARQQRKVQKSLKERVRIPTQKGGVKWTRKAKNTRLHVFPLKKKEKK